MITRELKHLIMGLDIGQKVDRTVITLLERLQGYADDPFEGKNKVGKTLYRLAYMKRLPLDTPTPQQVDIVRRTYDRIIEKYNKDRPAGKSEIKPTLIMDLGHTGQSHFDEYIELGMHVYGINFLGEAATSDRSPDRGVYNVRKIDLTSALSVLTENKRLIIPHDIPDRKLIIAELARFTWKFTRSGQTTAENLRDTDHDDIVSSLMVAAWYGEKGIREVNAGPPGFRERLGL